MAQLSRPYQIGLVAVAVLAAAWLLLLQGHHSSPSESNSSSASASPTRTVHAASTPAPAKAHAHGNAGSATGGGSASSLGGLGHAIEKAHGAVGTSQKNAKELESKSAQASRPNSSSSSAAAVAGAGAATHPQSAAPTISKAAPKSSPSTRGTVRATVAVRQHAVEAQLAQGKIALIFFWNPKGADDRAVNRSLAELPGKLRIAVDRARANAVATFGTITRGVQVYGTPTLLVVNKKGEVTTLTGLQDPYTIAQAIVEARR
ncbi:MAG TPA: hypothetical protein VIB59_04220 [Solirubrobacteraceae bacterium]|jgi:hypothetical protein